jgi:hypothetical protein
MNVKLSYWVDKKNIIQKVNDSWDQSMDAESWSDRAVSFNIIGKNILDFIVDDITRMYVASMLDAVRVCAKTLVKPYRCDSPESKRFMQMTVTPDGEGLIRVSHELIRAEPLKQRVEFFNEHDDIRFSAHHVRCSLCNKLKKIGTNNWEDVDKLSERGQLMPTGNPVVYGVCPRCTKGWPT